MPWFKQAGVVFGPVSTARWMPGVLALAFYIQISIFVESRSHSVSDTWYGILPDWAPTYLVWLWIAGRTSGKPSQ